jgi:hypothetical protein
MQYNYESTNSLPHRKAMQKLPFGVMKHPKSIGHMQKMSFPAGNLYTKNARGGDNYQSNKPIRKSTFKKIFCL